MIEPGRAGGDKGPDAAWVAVFEMAVRHGALPTEGVPPMPVFIARPSHHATPVIDTRLDQALKQAVLIGLVAVLALPAARGYHTWLGWMPLWLLGMPLSAWWALHRFRLPRRPAATARTVRRRPRMQARRRLQPQTRLGRRIRAA
jgi:hypothetical protein